MSERIEIYWHRNHEANGGSGWCWRWRGTWHRTGALASGTLPNRNPNANPGTLREMLREQLSRRVGLHEREMPPVTVQGVSLAPGPEWPSRRSDLWAIG